MDDYVVYLCVILKIYSVQVRRLVFEIVNCCSDVYAIWFFVY